MWIALQITSSGSSRQLAAAKFNFLLMKQFFGSKKQEPFFNKTVSPHSCNCIEKDAITVLSYEYKSL